jgi:hypothetical protein
MGNSKPVAERCWPNSTPEMSPSWMSTTRHDASVVIAARTNSSADAYTSVRYPNPESKFCRAVRIPASSSMIAITFRFVAIDLPWYWSVSRADWLSSTNRPAGASQRSNEAPEVRRGSLRGRVCRLKSLRAHSPDGFGARRASIDGDIRAIFRERLLPSAKGLFAHASLCCS